MVNKYDFSTGLLKIPEAVTRVHFEYKTPTVSDPTPKSQDREINLNALGQFLGGSASSYDGEKFIGGFGETKLFQADYWTLRKRSEQLFTENIYARGLIRRLITNEINTGLTPEAAPDEGILGKPTGSLNDWTETVENRFEVWASAPDLCDWKREQTFGGLQQTARREALICGDVLVVIRTNRANNLPAVQLISGSRVKNPPTEPRVGNLIKHGVEFDPQGRVVAYWVCQDDWTFKRLPAFGEKSGKRIAWLIFGTEKRLDEVRGQPLLSVVLQSLKEIDRYRDSAQRKAVINSVLAMFIKKTQDKPGTLPMTGGAVRRSEGRTAVSPQESPRSFGMTKHVPGVVMEELQTGEEPVGFHSQGTDINFPVFEAAVINAVAWANEVPPEILTLAFSNNYSASQAAINEFKIYLNRKWKEWGETFCSPIYVEWMVSETLLGKINPEGFLDSWNDPTKYDIFGAWVSVDWYGSIKPSTDTLKQARGAQIMCQEGWSTNAREARQISGTKFSKNINRLTQENAQKAAALKPFLDLQREYGFTYDQLQALVKGDITALGIEETEA